MRSMWSLINFIFAVGNPEVAGNVNFRCELSAAEKAGQRHPERSVGCSGKANGPRHRHKRQGSGSSPSTEHLFVGRVRVLCLRSTRRFLCTRLLFHKRSCSELCRRDGKHLRWQRSAGSCPLCWTVKPSRTHWDLGVYANLGFHLF